MNTRIVSKSAHIATVPVGDVDPSVAFSTPLTSASTSAFPLATYRPFSRSGTRLIRSPRSRREIICRAIGVFRVRNSRHAQSDISGSGTNSFSYPRLKDSLSRKEIGGEYFLSDHLSLGGEVQVRFTSKYISNDIVALQRRPRDHYGEDRLDARRVHPAILLSEIEPLRK
jgi:hypothetical protein